MATSKNGNGNGHKSELGKWTQEITELELFAENEGKLYPAKKRVIAAMKTKIERGQYDADLAVKGWRPWVDEAVAEYGRQFKMTNLTTSFPAIVRNEVARRIAEGEAEAIRNGDYGALQAKAPSKSPKAGAKYHTQYEGPTDTRGSRIVVTNLATKSRKTVPYDYGARDAHEAALAQVIGNTEGLEPFGDSGAGKYWKGTQSRGTLARYEHSANMWKPKPDDPDRAAKQTRLAALERKFEARAAEVPSNVMLFDDPTIARLVKERDRIIGAEPKEKKLPRINIGRIHLNRQGYTATGRYFGIGKPLFRAYNTANNQEVEFRASDRSQALGIVKLMFREPRHASVTELFTPGQVKDFVTND